MSPTLVGSGGGNRIVGGALPALQHLTLEHVLIEDDQLFLRYLLRPAGG